MSDQAERYFVYVGVRFNGTRLIGGLIPIATVDQLVGDTPINWYKAKKEIKALVIGGIYSAPASDAGITLKFKRIDRYREHSTVDRWRVLSDAAEVAERMRKLETNERTIDAISEALAPILAAYKATDAKGKRAIEALIIDRLHRAR